MKVLGVILWWSFSAKARVQQKRMRKMQKRADVKNRSTRTCRRFLSRFILPANCKVGFALKRRTIKIKLEDAVWCSGTGTVISVTVHSGFCIRINKPTFEKIKVERRGQILRYVSVGMRAISYFLHIECFEYLLRQSYSSCSYIIYAEYSKEDIHLRKAAVYFAGAVAVFNTGECALI